MFRRRRQNQREETPEFILAAHAVIPKNTQAATQSRAPVPDEAVDFEHICLRCSYKIARFPLLRCVENASLTTAKYIKCSKKKNDCEKVSELGFLSISLVLRWLA